VRSAGLRRFSPDELDEEDDVVDDTDTGTLPQQPALPSVRSIAIPPSNMSRESQGSQPGTSGLQSRGPQPRPSGLGFQAPPMSRAARILQLSYMSRQDTSAGISENCQNLSEEDDIPETEMYEEISQEDHTYMMSDATIVDETATTVVIDDGTEVHNYFHC